ncbi:MAG TPA: hypothetical protein VMV46_21605, partial [Thermoanaerobaculia bacterium]|nr:hypothetical protein [Thermoanaerobaculia bacterium]
MRRVRESPSRASPRRRGWRRRPRGRALPATPTAFCHHRAPIHEGATMNKREINPSEWLLAFNINHGIEVTG